jgi:NADH-quinone oxidoreductase subunit H
MYEFNLYYTVISVVGVLVVIVSICGFLIFLERKISAYIQDRIGPNRVGPAGLLQPLADVLKFVFKEDIIPAHVDKLLFLLAPAIALTTALLAFAVVPFGAPTGAATPLDDPKAYPWVIAPGIDIGIVFIFAVTSLTVYGIILGGWSANNKYSFIGGLRSSAQLVSYEIPMGMSILGIVLLTGSLNLERIIAHQAEAPPGGWWAWNICYQPLAFLLFLVSAFAECNRLPFDLPEAEQELVGGYHTEYSALKFAMFFLGEYTHMVTTSFLMVILFFGGWHFPWIAELDGSAVLKFLVFFGKMSFFILIYMWVRWTIPRFRFDQLMGLAWRVLIPLALLNLLTVLVVKHLIWSLNLSPFWLWLLLPLSAALLIGYGVLAVLAPVPTSQRVVRPRLEEPAETVAR